MSQNELNLPSKITRASTVESQTVDESGQRIVTLSFASEAMIDKGSYFEVLSHRAEDVNFEWLNSGYAPIITDHEAEADNVIGKVVNAWLDGSVSRANVLIGSDEKSDVYWKKIQSGILNNVSVGCNVTGYTVDRTTNPDKPIVYCKWEPSEISFCALPIDRSIGIGRSEKNSDKQDVPVDLNNPVVKTGEAVQAQAVLESTDVVRSTASPVVIQITKQNQKQNKQKGFNKMTTENLSTEDIQRAERLRTNEIIAIATEFKASDDIVRAAIESGKSAAEFGLEVLRTKKTAPVQTALGLTNQEAKEYSIARAVQAIITGDHSDAGYEIEVSRAYAKANGKAHKATSLYVPDEVIRAASANAMTASANAAAGLKTRGAWIEALRAKTIAGRLGVNMVGGLVGTLELPKFLTLPQARFVNEGQDGTLDAVTTGVVTLAPRSVISLVEVTRSMVNNLPSIESQLNQELLAAIATRIDQEVFATVLADTDVIANLKVTPASGVTYAEIRALITKLSNADVNTDVAKFALNGDVEGYLSSTLKSDNTAALYLRGEDGRIAGLQSEYSRTVGGDHLLVGDWSKVTVGAWGGIELAADTSTKFASGGTQLRAIADVDVGVTVPAAITGYKDLVV